MHESELTGKPRFIAEVALGVSTALASERAGVTTRCGSAWLQHDDVRREIRDLRARSMLAVTSKVAGTCDEAVETLLEIMRHGRSDHARVNATLGLLSTASEWVQLDSLAASIEDLQAERSPDAIDVRSQLRTVVGSPDSANAP